MQNGQHICNNLPFTSFSPFQINYGYNPRAPIDLAPVPDLVRKSGKAADFIKQLEQIHGETYQALTKFSAKYKADVDKKRRAVEFEVGDYVWAVLTKERFPAREYNKLSARKIGPLEIVEKINSNAYCLKLPSHIRTSDVFNVKHLVPYKADNSDDDVDVANSRANFLHHGGNDGDRVDSIALDFMERWDSSY
ncbi:hypothetical protein ACOSQ4_019982 [Xanthoceras sorbifolium]